MHRREALTLSALASAGLAFKPEPVEAQANVQAASRGRGPLKIAKVEAMVVRSPRDAKPQESLIVMDPIGATMAGGVGRTNRIDTSSPSRTPGYEQAVVVKITTADGLYGWGECHAPVAPRVHVQIIKDILAPILIGQDARQVEALWERMYRSERVRGYSTGDQIEAIAGIDIALWDLLGKYAGVPVYQLLGGRYRSQISTYATFSATYTGRKTEQTSAERATQMVEAGFKVLKMALRSGPGSKAFDEVLAVAKAVGSKANVAVDALGAFTLADAIVTGRELDKIGNIAWMEDALLPDQMQSYPDLARAVDTAICAGEALSTRFQFRDLMAQRGVDMINPDLCRCGGITEGRRIVWLADVFGVLWAPHVSTGTAPYMAASIHLGVSTPNAVMMEVYDGYKHDGPLGNRLLKAPLDMGPGFAKVPERPGLGVDFDEKALAQVVVA
ncbi:MAG: mandelate racemase/muconate lactonizing enzyme family protein [Vicinamibacteria bacterium]